MLGELLAQRVDRLQHLIDRRPRAGADKFAQGAVTVVDLLAGRLRRRAGVLGAEHNSSARRGARRHLLRDAPPKDFGRCPPGAQGAAGTSVSWRATETRRSRIGDCGEAEDIEILRGLLRGAQRHEIEVGQHRIPVLGVIGLVEPDHIAFEPLRLGAVGGS